MLRLVPKMEGSANCRRPFKLEIANKAGLNFDWLFGLDVHKNDCATLVHWDKKSLAHGKIVAGIDEGGGFRVNDQGPNQAFGGHSPAFHVKCKVKVPKDFQRIDPGL